MKKTLPTHNHNYYKSSTTCSFSVLNLINNNNNNNSNNYYKSIKRNASISPRTTPSPTITETGQLFQKQQQQQQQQHQQLNQQLTQQLFTMTSKHNSNTMNHMYTNSYQNHKNISIIPIEEQQQQQQQQQQLQQQHLKREQVDFITTTTTAAATTTTTTTTETTPRDTSAAAAYAVFPTASVPLLMGVKNSAFHALYQHQQHQQNVEVENMSQEEKDQLIVENQQISAATIAFSLRALCVKQQQKNE